jgi:hypothetical protein
MPHNRSSNTISELEREILRALCGRECLEHNWTRLAGQLARYSWREPDHRVVYEALTAIQCRDSKMRRDQLAAQATRMGFPDVNWSLYLATEELSARRIQALIRRLKAETAARP